MLATATLSVLLIFANGLAPFSLLNDSNDSVAGIGPYTNTDTLKLDDILLSSQLRSCDDVSRALNFSKPQVFYRRCGAILYSGVAGSVPSETCVKDMVLPSLVDKLMIVAHADDEVIFGGRDLIAGPPETWLVVAVNSPGALRASRLNNVTAMLDLGGFLSLAHWDNFGLAYYEASLAHDLDTLMRWRTWSTLVVHGANGEYGHVQHRSLHTLVIALAMALPAGNVQGLRVFAPLTRTSQITKPELDKLSAVLTLYGDVVVRTTLKMLKRSMLSVPYVPTEEISLKNLTHVVCQKAAVGLYRH